MIDPGDLDQRVTVRREMPGEPNRFGEPGTPTVATVPYWSKVEPLSGRELEQAGKIAAEATHRFTFRQPIDVRTTDQIAWSGRVFEVHHVAAPPRQSFVTVLASETK